MEEYERKSLVFCSLIALIFLVAISSVSFHAEGRGDSLPECVYPEGTTVQSLQKQFGGNGNQVFIIKSDGAMRSSGPVATGDILKVMDSQGNLLTNVALVIGQGSSSESSQPSSESPLSSSDSSSSGQPVSSGDNASDPDSTPRDSSSATSSGSGEEYVFSGPVTVEKLEDQIRDKIENEGCSIDVTSPTGTKRNSGAVCTGDVVRVLDSEGKTEDCVVAVILGDLTRSGGDTRQDSEVLYEFLTGQRELTGDLLRAADLDRNGEVDTRDLLFLKKQSAARTSG